MTVRLGAIGYLNTRPLIAGLEAETGFELSYGAPSACAAQLREGRVDLGLIPTVEYARSPEPYYIVPEVGIACRGEVLSVKFLFRGELAAVRRVALDRSSRTSAALLRILLRERHGVVPEFVEAHPDLDGMLAAADGALLIGDLALELEGDRLSQIDLGAEWSAHTGHPFVFAVWAGRRDALTPAQARRLVQARRHGEGRLEEIARRFADGRGRPRELYERYLRQHIRFELGAAELAGLRHFYGLACQHGLIPQVPELRFYQTGGDA
jgi:chorismate dehydratase